MSSPLLSVLPILPSAAGLATFLIAGFFGLAAALLSLRWSSFKRLSRIVWRQKWGLVTLTLAIVLVAKGFEFASARQVATRPSSLADHRWLLFRGSLDRSGQVDQHPGPRGGGVRWSVGRGFEFHSTPAIVGEAVIAVGCQGDTARFFCANAMNGELVWSTAPSGYRATFSSAVVDQGYMICGEGLHQTTESRLTCFDLTSGIPQVCGQFTTRSHIECTPVIDNGRVYFGAGDDGIYCLELPRRPATGLKEVWHVSGPNYLDAETALTVHQGRVYVGLGFGGEALCVLDANSGQELRRVKLPLPLFSPPAIRDDRIYVGLGRADFVHYRDTPPGEVRCLDLNTLETLWTIPTSSAVLSAIVATPAQIYFSTVDGEVLAADQQGRVLHKWSAHTSILAAPAVTTDLVYCVDCDGVLTGLSRNLDRVFSVRLGAAGDYISSPVIFHGRLFVGTPTEGLMCVGEALSPGSEASNEDAPVDDRSSIPLKVETAWQFTPEVPVAGEVVFTAPPAVGASAVVVPVAAQSWSGIAYADVQPQRPPRTRYVQEFPEVVAHAPVIRGDKIVQVTGEPGKPGQLIVLQRETGQIVWQEPVQLSPGAMLVDGDSVYYQPTAGEFVRRNLQGHLVWRVELGALAVPPGVRGSIVIVVATKPDELLALDRDSGQTLWKVSLPARPRITPIILGKQILVPMLPGLESRSLIDGCLQQTFGDWDNLGTFFADEQQMIGMTDAGELLQGASLSGSILRRWAGLNAGVAPALGSGEILLVDLERRLLRLSPDNPQEPVLMFIPPENRRILHSPVTRDGRVYVIVEGRGLVCLTARSTP